ncbi:MAG: Maf family protein [Bacteroidales bacterium]|nr:Maf family protein [Bacteroidales bacterium]MDD4575709.1 Maf family protein [Bacteroidales bacterium]
MIINQIINKHYHLVLGSASPRRKEMLSQMGFEFEIRISNAEEIYNPENSPEEIVKQLSLQKSKDISLLSQNELLITADTIVVLNQEILGKPKDYTEAFQMIQKLSDNEHQVFTGVCLRTEQKIITDFAVTSVLFKPIAVDEIDYYIMNYQPYDKAGAYGIQEWLGFHKIQEIKGSYFNVVGLPCTLISEMMKSFI